MARRGSMSEANPIARRLAPTASTKRVITTMILTNRIRFVNIIVVITLLVEAVGASLLAIGFASDMEPLRAIYLGIFHAVSAFNNAGFSLYSENLIPYRSDLLVNLTISL